MAYVNDLHTKRLLYYQRIVFSRLVQLLSEEGLHTDMHGDGQAPRTNICLVVHLHVP